MGYVLGPVKPWVKAAADKVGGMFGVGTIYGVASRSTVSDHPLGLALDFMVYGDREKGDSVAQYVHDNATALNVKYVIWYQHIWSPARSGEGWRQMEDRGSVTANHMDHVHVSFNSTANGAVIVPASDDGDSPYFGLPDQIPNPFGGIKDGIDAANAFFGWLSDGHNWLRIAYVVGGILIILFAFIKIGVVSAGLAGKGG